MNHGVPRVTGEQAPKSVQARQKELQEIEAYQKLIEEVNEGIKSLSFTPELLQKTSSLLQKNPEYYTIWNHRRRIYEAEFASLAAELQSGALEREKYDSQILDIIQLDLQFLFPLLLKFPKCYWIWNHRLWLLQSATTLLPVSTARKLWTEELGLVSKMLSRDSRNFHGWGYRRKVIAALESSQLDGSSMVRSEFDYTTKMIGLNLSNFSAWHNRTHLILRLLDEENANDASRKKMLDDEISLIHKALFDPYDQSLWFYHQTLMACFDPGISARTMAPNLSSDEKQTYIRAEREFIEELLDDAIDCKWVYQSLIECAVLEGKCTGDGLSEQDKKHVKTWIAELKKLDPLRKGRWEDMEKKLG